MMFLRRMAKAGKGDPCVDTFIIDRAESKIENHQEANVCAGKGVSLTSLVCVNMDPGHPQAGGNVTKGFQGSYEMSGIQPLTTMFHLVAGMCPVNVHWHLGTEHYSYGQYDENGNGPNGNIPRPEWADSVRRLQNEEPGFRCHHYNPSDPKFTKEYEWKHCLNMEVGETYEVHWPHSVAGDCGTPNQYQEPFKDGVFCHLTLEQLNSLTAQEVANSVGVQSQVFTIVNDEAYFYPDMIRGMIIDGEMGSDVAHYTGSTTGTSVDNNVCSPYSPISWQVDRKCHLISASSFDKLCYDMKMQRDDMSNDLHPHGSRELVKDDLVANNMQRKAQGES
eukprot:CCRYP_000099-RA/>CCRYP_000099-RA protein AED:0.01 eAED:-0.00 QI:213/0.66/0.25/1/0.66/0.5/4/0/333